jgi:hypothetical protein
MLSLATLEMGMVGPKKAGLYIINSQRLGYASLTPSTCQGYLALDGQTSHSVNVSNLGCDSLSTFKSWFSAIRFPNSILSPQQYFLCSVLIFVSFLTSEVTES